MTVIPSTDWAERPLPDEAQRHAEFSDVISGIQARVNTKQGPGRAFHRKQIAGFDATLTVHDSLPHDAAQGLFAQPGEFPTKIRMSNGAIAAGPDIVPDIRGFAVSVRGVTGPGALGGTTDRQDFLLINRPTFGFVDTRDFAEVVPLAARGQRALVTGLIESKGIVAGSAEAARLVKDIGGWFSGFATTRFHSAAPIQYGPFAAKIRLVPDQTGMHPRAPLDWGQDVRRRLARADLTWQVQVQFFVSEALTPIEDGRVTWREQDSPFIPVATLTATPRDLESPAASDAAAAIEQSSFDPWAALADHRPLGEIMRARKVAYLASQRLRDARP